MLVGHPRMTMEAPHSVLSFLQKRLRAASVCETRNLPHPVRMKQTKSDGEHGQL